MAAVPEDSEDKSMEIIVGDETFKCSKSNLEECSDYFKAMFTSNMTECLTNRVQLHEISATTFAILADYTNTREITCDSGNVMDILESACMFQFIQVIEHCETYIIKHLSCDNCLLTMCFARSHGLDNMYTIAKRMALWFASRVIPTPQIECLSYEDLKDYLGHSLLNIDDELILLRGIDRWTQQHDEKNISQMNNVLDCVRLENLKLTQLSQLISCPICKQCEVFTKKVATFLQQKEENNVKIRPRKLPESLCILKNEGHQLMVTESGEIISPRSHLCAIDVDHIVNKASISELTQAPWEGRKNGPIGYRACVIGCCVYVFGGELSLGTGRWIDDVWEYHTLKQLWRSVCRLPSPRRHHSLAVYQNDVYISGGFGRHRIILNTVVKFSLTTGTFEELQPLPSTMYNCCSLVHDNKLYVFKSSILCLDLDNPSQWFTYELPSQVDHHITSACQFQGTVYLGYCNAMGLLCEMDPRTVECCTTGDFGAYKKAYVQNVMDEDSTEVEEELVLFTEQGMVMLCEKDGKLCVKSRVDLDDLDLEDLEYMPDCLLAIPSYASV